MITAHRRLGCHRHAVSAIASGGIVTPALLLVLCGLASRPGEKRAITSWVLGARSAMRSRGITHR